MTLEEKVGQLFMVGVQDEQHMRILIEKYNVGGIIYFTRNVENAYEAYQLSSLVKRKSKIPAFISIDQEGGTVTRIKKGIAPVPGQMAVAATERPEYAKQVSEILSSEMSLLGINMNLGPVVDINNNPHNPVINVRSYGDNSEDVSVFSLNALEGYKTQDMIAVAKHFPGHGDTDLDSHTSLPVVTHDMSRLNDIELKPFKLLVDNGLDAVMVSHVLFSKISTDNKPATLSREIVHDLLRVDLEFDGLIMTDCMEMHAVSKHFGIEESVIMSLEAGVDILLISHTLETQISSINAVTQAVKDGRLDEEMIDKAVDRILKYKSRYNIEKKLEPWELIKNDLETEDHYALAKKISMKSMTLIGDEIAFDPNPLYVFPKTAITEVLLKPQNTFLYNTLDDFEVSQIIQAAKGYKQVVFGSRGLKQLTSQNEIIRKLNCVVVLLESPYDFSELECKSCLCTYEMTQLALESLLTIVKGSAITGKLPISV
jgi:beta-N-acetylhexosaminidase